MIYLQIWPTLSANVVSNWNSRHQHSGGFLQACDQVLLSQRLARSITDISTMYFFRRENVQIWNTTSSLHRRENRSINQIQRLSSPYLINDQSLFLDHWLIVTTTVQWTSLVMQKYLVQSTYIVKILYNTCWHISGVLYYIYYAAQ